MSVNVRKIRSAKSLTDALKKVKPVKPFDSQKHLGKIDWGENPVEYQKRIRNEWD